MAKQHRIPAAVQVTMDVVTYSSIPLVMLILFAGAMFGTSQGRELAQVLTDRDPNVEQYLWLISALSIWALMQWNWSRIRLDAGIPDWRQNTGDVLTHNLVAWAPRALGAAPFLVMGLHIFKLGSDDSQFQLISRSAGLFVLGGVFFAGFWWRTYWLELPLARMAAMLFLAALTICLPTALIVLSVAEIYVPADGQLGTLFAVVAFVASLGVFVFILPPILADQNWAAEANQLPAVEEYDTGWDWLTWAAKPLRIRSATAYFVFFQVFLLSGATALVIGLFPLGTGQALGAPAIVAVGFAALLPLLSMIALLGRYYLGAPLWAVLVALFLATGFLQANLWPRFLGCGKEMNCSRYAIRSLTWGTFIPDREANYRVSAQDRPTVSALAEEWLSQFDGVFSEEPIPIVFVAASGGGQKAAFWTARVLGQAEQEQPGISKNIIGISAVSGGALGSAVHVGLLDSYTIEPFAEAGERIIAQDGVGPTFGALIFGDMFSNFAPVGWAPDRAETLEQVWESGWRSIEHSKLPDFKKEDGAQKILVGKKSDKTCSVQDLFNKNFLCIWNLKHSAWRPALLLNGTLQNDGSPILTSSVVPEPSWGIVDFYDLASVGNTCCDRTLEVRTSTAVLNSARFPYVSPAGLVIREDRKIAGRIIDGGYIDNSGAKTMRLFAQSVLEYLENHHGDRRFQPVFIEIINQSEFAVRGCPYAADEQDAVVSSVCAGAAKFDPVEGKGSRHKIHWPRIEFFEQLDTPFVGFSEVYEKNGARAAKELHEAILALREGRNALGIASPNLTSKTSEREDQVALDTEGAETESTSDGSVGTIVDPLYLQFALCPDKVISNPLGWSHASRTVDTYANSIAPIDEAREISQRVVRGSGNAQYSCKERNRYLLSVLYCASDQNQCGNFPPGGN